MILAVADNGVIGVDAGLPWHLPEDLKRFKALTTGRPVVMGRRTWDSLPRKPLPGRDNLVVTREPGFAAEGAVAVPSLEDAFAQARILAETEGHDEIFLIGGASLYLQALDQEGAHRVDRIEMTAVHLEPEGDVSMPPFDMEEWHETAREAGTPHDGITYDFITLVRSREVEKDEPDLNDEQE